MSSYISQRLEDQIAGDHDADGEARADSQCRKDGELLPDDLVPSSPDRVLRDVVRRGMPGVKLVISDALEGIEAATARVLSTTWQRCRVHFQRYALAHAGKSSRRVASALIATAFAQPDHSAAQTQCRLVADQMQGKLPKLAALMDGAEEYVVAYITFPSGTGKVALDESD